jgi:hypothetical protein
MSTRISGLVYKRDILHRLNFLDETFDREKKLLIVDHKKSFDNVNRQKLFNILKRKNILRGSRTRRFITVDVYEIWYGGNAIQGDLDAIIFNPIASIILELSSFQSC